MNSIKYTSAIEDTLKRYLTFFKNVNTLNNEDSELSYKDYRKNSLYFLVALNYEKSEKHKDLFKFLYDNLDQIIISQPEQLELINKNFVVVLKECNLDINTRIRFYTSEYKYSNYTLKIILRDHLFKYSLLTTERKKVIFNSIKNKVCPYCSRNFINQITGISHNMGVNLDHYYSRNSYPIFSISFYNFIPSCQTCNSTFKNKIDTSEHKKRSRNRIFLHPICDDLDSAEFILDLKKYDNTDFRAEYFLNQDNFEINYVRSNSRNFDEDSFKRFDKSAELFEIKKIYNAHKDVVQRTLIDYYVYTEGEVLKSIQKTFPMLNLEHKVLGIGTSKEDWLYLPFGKLKYDIISNLLRNKTSKVLKE